jgi:hypothetical protein
MNNFECSISEREHNRKDYSPEFMADTMTRGPQHGHDPYNNVGISCGVSWPSVYQFWDDIWLFDQKTHDAFRAYLRNPSEANLRRLNHA